VSEVWSNAVTALAALGGVALASLTQHWTNQRARREQHGDRVADLTAQLLDAVLDYRELYWLWIEGLRHGETEHSETRAARARAQSAITKARARLRMATSHTNLLTAAKEASWSAIELSDIPLSTVVTGTFTDEVEAALAAGRERTRTAHTALEKAAAAYAQKQRPGIVRVQGSR
jgi:hypothetical protein